MLSRKQSRGDLWYVHVGPRSYGDWLEIGPFLGRTAAEKYIETVWDRLSVLVQLQWVPRCAQLHRDDRVGFYNPPPAVRPDELLEELCE